jgi:hypothetical protein
VKKSASFVAASLILCISIRAHADQAADSAAAQSLYDEGRRLLRQGRAIEACPKFEASQKLDPAPGTQFHLADCYEKTGRTASAWALFLEVAAQARTRVREEQEKIARDRAAALESKVSKLTFVWPRATRIPGLKVTRNGTEVDQALFGTPVSVDPGLQRIVAEAPGYETATLELTIGEASDQQTVNIPALKKLAGNAASEPLAGDSASSAHARPDTSSLPDQGKPTPRAGLRSASYVALAVGAVGVGAGTFFVLRSASKRSDADEAFEACGADCLEDNPQARKTVELDDQARDARAFAAVAFIAGGVGIAGGVTLFLLSRSPKAAERTPQSRAQSAPAPSFHPWIGPGSAGFSGSF